METWLIPHGNFGKVLVDSTQTLKLFPPFFHQVVNKISKKCGKMLKFESNTRGFPTIFYGEIVFQDFFVWTYQNADE